MKLFLKIIGAIFALLILMTAGGVAANWRLVNQILTYSPLILPPFYGDPTDRAEAQQQDIRFLRRLTKYDRSFSFKEIEAFNAQVDAMAARAGDMTDAEFYLSVSKAAAISDNGHTNASKSPSYRQFNHAGVRFYWFADGLFIVRAENTFADLVGAKVTGVEGRSPEDVNAALSIYTGGAAQFRKLYGVHLLESPDLMHAAGLARSPDELTLTVLDKSGETHSITLPAIKEQDQETLPIRRPWMSLRGDALPGENGDWSRVLDFENGGAPLYLEAPEENFLVKKLEGGVYLRPQLLLQREETPILEQFQSVIDDAPAGGYNFMAVDLRLSPGGDYTKVLDFVQAAPQTLSSDGRLYIITSPQTFSAALVTAAFLKYYGGDQAVIIGEPMGDHPQFWAETGFPFALPNTEYRISYATGYHDWEAGCTGKHEYCFTQNILHEVPAGSLEPGIALAPTFSDYASGRDIIMDRILAEQP